jgi:hypothetical protein
VRCGSSIEAARNVGCGGINGVKWPARSSRPELKVLFINGYAENAVIGHGHLDSRMHVMTKPFELEALASRIRELITAAT